jgi:SEC-C motif
MLSSAECPSVAARCRAGEHVSADLRAAVLADRERAVPALLQVLTDEELAYESAPHGGWAPIHAVDLLVALGAHAAIEPMLELLSHTEFDDIVHSRIVIRLPALGAAVLEPALAHIARTTDPDVRHALSCVIAALGVRDERIYAVLCQLFETDPIRTSVCLAQYGDVHGLELLYGAIMDFEPDYSSVGNRCDFQCMVEQYKTLGTSLPAALTEHVAELERRWELVLHGARNPVVPSTSVKLGRNDLCLCGSGKKYKRCCLGKARM